MYLYLLYSGVISYLHILESIPMAKFAKYLYNRALNVKKQHPEMNEFQQKALEKFESPYNYLINTEWKLSAVEDYKAQIRVASVVSTSFQFSAIKTCYEMRKKSEADDKYENPYKNQCEDPSFIMKFQTASQSEAFAFGVSLQNVFKFSSISNIKALEKGVDEKHAIKITSKSQLEYIDIFPNKIDEAIQVKSIYQLEARKIGIIFEKAMKFSKQVQIDTYKLDYNEEDSLLVRTKFQYNLLAKGADIKYALMVNSKLEEVAWFFHLPNFILQLIEDVQNFDLCDVINYSSDCQLMGSFVIPKESKEL